MKKYSTRFEESYAFYLSAIGRFTFSGTASWEKSFVAEHSESGVSAKEAFFRIDSTGRNTPTSEPKLLNNLLQCKASVNFQIKQWAEGRAEGSLPLCEFSQRLAGTEIKDGFLMEWKDQEPVYAHDIETHFRLPGWVMDAVEAQKLKHRIFKKGQ